MDKEQLLDVLLSQGLNEEHDDLYNDDVTVQDWVSRHEDLIKSNQAVAKALQVDAPHDVSKNYFKDKNEERKYKASEAKYNEELAKRQQIADEYRRAKELKEASEFSSDKSFADNFNAFWLKLTPQSAKNVYIKEGYKPTKLAVHGSLGTMANVAELAPGVGTVGKLITTFAGPTIRAGQELAEGKDASEVAKNAFTDAGLNTVFSYLPLREAYGYVKRILGQGGRGEKAAKNAVEDVLEQADAIADKKETLSAISKDEKNLSQFIMDFKDGKLNDIDISKYADEIKELYPQLSKALKEDVQLHAKQRQADVAADMAMLFDKNLAKKWRKAGKEYTKKFDASKANIDNEVDRAIVINEDKKKALTEEMFDDSGALIEPSDYVEQAAKLANPSKAAKVIAKTKPVLQGFGRLATDSYRDSVAPEDKEYNSAIEYIIQANRRQWNAGFKPRGGIELEAYNIAKQRGEI